MVKSETLEIALANAESVLARTVIESVEPGTSWSETKHLLDKVRANCRQLHAALVELSGLESTANFNEARDHCREIRAVFLRLYPSASIPFRCIDPLCFLLRSPRTTCWISYLEASIATHSRLATVPDEAIEMPAAAPAQVLTHLDGKSSKLRLVSRNARRRPSLLRQASDLFVLVAAYLGYYLVDVQLQIVSLPALITWLKR